jgi:hypothetical protein
VEQRVRPLRSARVRAGVAIAFVCASIWLGTTGAAAATPVRTAAPANGGGGSPPLGGVATVAVLAMFGGAIMLWKRLGNERREAIDIDAVIDSKYPNRHSGALDVVDDEEIAVYDLDAADALDAIRAADPPKGLVEDEEFDAIDAGQPFDIYDTFDEPEDGTPNPSASPASPASPSSPIAAVEQAIDDLVDDAPAATRPAGRATTASTGLPPKPRRFSPATPLPGEPDDFFEPVAKPAAGTAPRGDTVDAFSGDPYQQLARRRARIAAQAAEAFQEVHKLRTEALRRASQAEHNASLAANARTRAGRMVRDTRRVESQGRRRPSQVPSHEDAYGDVHRFRTEALKRAQQAEHGALNVAQARERATRLLAEQREIEAEMAKLQRLRNAAAAVQKPH